MRKQGVAMTRLDQLRSFLDEQGYDAFLATVRSNQLTFVDHPDPTAVFTNLPYLLVTPGACVVFPGLWISNACRDLLTRCEVIANEVGDPPVEEQLMAYVQRSGIRKVAMDALGGNVVEALQGEVSGLTVASEGDAVRAMRRRRTPEEIEMIRKTAEIGDAGLDAAFRAVRPGVTARDVEAEGVATMLRLGCERALINVVTGPATYYLDSGNDCRRTIQEIEMLFMDISISYRGYLGDQTRPAIMGEGTPAQRDLLETVKRSFYEVRAALVPGARAQDVYAIHCRNMEHKGWRKYFYHHISHGVGLGGSDAGPRIDSASEDVLQEDDVISCEPGVYVPEIGGARVEDIVHVTKDGPVALTRSAIDRVIAV